MGRTVEEQRGVYLNHILINIERLQQSYTKEENSEEWELLNKINELLEEFDV